MSDGWIKIHRSILDDELYFSEKFTKMQAWIDLLLLAEYKPRAFYVRGIQVKLERGQLAVSIRDLAARWKWGVNKVQSFIKELVVSEKLNTQKSSVITIITVCKYDYYQDNDSTLRLKTDIQTDIQTDTPLRNKESKEDIISSPDSLSRADGDAIFRQLEVMMKKIRDLSEKTEALQNGATKQPKEKKGPNPLITKGREVFEARYAELFENAYYWQAKDAVAMGSLTKKLIHSRKEKNLGTSDDEVISALRVFLSLIKDEWILKNFSLTNIDSKYNEIVAQAKAAKNTTNGNNSRTANSTTEQRYADAASNIADFIDRIENKRPADEDITALWK